MEQQAQQSFTPYGAIRDLWLCRDPEVLIPGPAGTGKTRGVLEKVHLYLLKYAGARGLIVRQTRESLTQSTMVTFENNVARAGVILDRGGSRSHRSAYQYTNGSELVMGGLDKPGKMMSAEYDIIAICEATEVSENSFELLLLRCRYGVGPYQQIIAECNPQGPTHWLKRRADRGRMTVFNSTHKENPKMWDGEKWTKFGKDYYTRNLDGLTGHRRARLMDGKWAASEGLVYPEFDAAVHVIQSMPDGWQSWRKIRSMDFGFVHPFVCQWWAIDGDGRMYMYREVYRAKRTTDEHAKQINELSQGELYEATVTDHDPDVRGILAKAGIQSVLAEKNHGAGRDAVHARLRLQGDGKPRIFVLAGCTHEVDGDLYERKRPTSTLAEFDSYVYPPGRDGKAEKEDPVKECDDGMDAMRYAVMYFDSPKRTYGAYAAVGSGVPEDKQGGILTTTDGTGRHWY